MRLVPALMLMAVTAAVPAAAQTPRAPAAAASPAPAGWEATKARVMALGLDGKHQEMLAAIEPVVARNPGFVDGLFWFGAAHENLGRDAMRSDPARAKKHFETAATSLRKVFDLGGGDSLDATIRGLIDLYEYALPDAATRKALIIEARTRHGAEPVVHWYYLQLLIDEQRTAEFPAAFAAARKALPATPDVRVSFTELLIGLAERTAAGAARTALAAEADAYANEILKANPTGRLNRRGQALKDDIAKLRQPKDRQ